MKNYTTKQFISDVIAMWGDREARADWYFNNELRDIVIAVLENAGFSNLKDLKIKVGKLWYGNNLIEISGVNELATLSFHYRKVRTRVEKHGYLDPKIYFYKLGDIEDDANRYDTIQDMISADIEMKEHRDSSNKQQIAGFFEFLKEAGISEQEFDELCKVKEKFQHTDMWKSCSEDNKREEEL